MLELLDARPGHRVLDAGSGSCWSAALLVILGVCGVMPAAQPWIIISQVAAAYYFAHFLIIMPLIPHFERPLPLPNSITEAVLGDHHPAAAHAGAPVVQPA